MNLREQLRKQLFDVLLPTPPSAWPGDEDDLFLLGLDSLRITRLLAWIERTLGIELPDGEITPERIGSVAALLELIENFGTHTSGR